VAGLSRGKNVIELLVAASAFFCMLGAFFVGFKIHSQYCTFNTHSQTHEMIGLISNMFVVVTALVLGLMLNSAKGTFEKNNNNVRTLASQIIVLDRTMRSLAPEAAEARGHLLRLYSHLAQGAEYRRRRP
jgi:hypothetical protein